LNNETCSIFLLRAGFYVQALATGKGPTDNLLTHLADPFHTTAGSNFM
jgi:hypothetical protein